MSAKPNSSPLKHKASRGFTLIEVLLAVSITAVAAIMAYQSMDSASRLAEVSQQQSDALQRLSTAMFFIQKDFHHIVARKVRNPDGDGFEAAFRYNAFSLPNLEFTRSGKLNPQLDRFQRSHLERVAYYLDDQTLMRYSWAMPDHYGEDPQKVVLFEDVESFSLSFIQADNANASNPLASPQTIQQWPPDELADDLNSLPAFAIMTIETKNWGVLTRKFEFIEQELLQ
ncbi:MAG: type II secretion system minor pseudopilin GspJ [Pseudomonadales bacterium]|nr:type II secretion system minor pseudopilin GspJ [Pseudomonadales bacterium]